MLQDTIAQADADTNKHVEFNQKLNKRVTQFLLVPSRIDPRKMNMVY